MSVHVRPIAFEASHQERKKSVPVLKKKRLEHLAVSTWTTQDDDLTLSLTHHETTHLVDGEAVEQRREKKKNPKHD